jgi:hypothetical protein
VEMEAGVGSADCVNGPEGVPVGHIVEAGTRAEYENFRRRKVGYGDTVTGACKALWEELEEHIRHNLAVQREVQVQDMMALFHLLSDVLPGRGYPVLSHGLSDLRLFHSSAVHVAPGGSLAVGGLSAGVEGEAGKKTPESSFSKILELRRAQANNLAIL